MQHDEPAGTASSGSSASPTGNTETSSEKLFGAEDIQTMLDTLAGQLCQEYAGTANLALVGIQRRGDVLAQRLRDHLSRHFGAELPCGSLDITLYRDDFDSLAEQPVVGTTHIPFALDEKTIILVDDVLFTGRTIRAALDVLVDLGRPTRIVLVVLIDRGWRELPIAPDFAGKTLTTAQDDDVQVRLSEVDGEDEVLLISPTIGS